MLQRNKTVPFRDINPIKLMIEHLSANYDKTYLLIFKMALLTGFRISDILSLKYKDNLKDDFIFIIESKRKLSLITKAKNKVLFDVKELLVAQALAQGDLKKLNSYTLLLPVDVYQKLSSAEKSVVDKKIKAAVNKIKHKTRFCKIPQTLVNELKTRKRKYSKIDNGFIFSQATLIASKLKNKTETISRVTVWKIFSTAGKELNFDFPTSCHGLRKTYAVRLYEQSGNDSQLVIKNVGWEDEKILQRYLSVENSKADNAVKDMQNEILST